MQKRLTHPPQFGDLTQNRWISWGAALWAIGMSTPTLAYPLPLAGGTPQAIAQAPDPTVIRSTLKPGSRGAEVSEVQAALKLLGYYTGPVDGVYGNDTVAAISRFQQSAGITADGIMGPETWNRLFPAAEGTTSTATPPTPATPSPSPGTKPPTAPTDPPTTPPSTPSVLRRGMKGSEVERLQSRLQARGFLKGSIDGIFGADTEDAVKEAQRTFRLTPDGVVGPATWTILEDLPVLRRGATGSAVERLQTLLQSKGFLSGGTDGTFGAQTEEAVKEAQRSFRLTVDGVVGGSTWDALLR